DVVVDRERALLADHARQAFERRREAEVVERRGPELDRQPADVAERRVDKLANHRERLLADLALERLQAEEDRRERLPCLVVQLARQPAAFGLLPFEERENGTAPDALRQLD